MLLKRKEPGLLQFLMILILLNDRLYTMPFLEHQDFPVFPNIEGIIFILAIFVLVYKNGDTTEQLLTHSSVPKGHPIGCFLVPCLLNWHM